MGSIVINCAVSNLPIQCGEEIVLIFIGKCEKDNHWAVYPWCKWEFMSMPIHCKMDDYGMHGSIGSEDSDNKFKETLDIKSRIAFNSLKRHIFFAGPDTYNYNENNWYRGLFSNEKTRHSGYYPRDPSTLTTDMAKWMYGTETRTSIFIVRKDIYNRLIELSKDDSYVEDRFERYSKSFDAHLKYWKAEKTESPENIEKQKNEFLNDLDRSFPSGDYAISTDITTEISSIFRNSTLVESDFYLIRDSLKELICICSAMQVLSKIIQPNICLAPQDGWNSVATKYVNDFNKFCYDLGKKKIRENKY